MTLRTGIFIFAIIALLCSACSEEKKREAARLEARLRGDTLAFADSQTTATDSLADSTAVDSMNNLATVAFDSSRPAADSPMSSDQMASNLKDTTTTQPVGQTEDSVIPDVNAVPAENGQTAHPSMPQYIQDAYTVQVASSTDQAFSQQVVDTFLARGYDAYLGTVTREGTTYYRVRVGHYATSTEANLVAVEINRKYSLEGWVDKITK